MSEGLKKSSGLLDVIVDVSRWQKGLEVERLGKQGISAVIVKASQGLTIKDSEYDGFSSKSRTCGYLTGAYHFGTNAPGDKQADFFLGCIDWKNNKGTMMVLDWETNAQITMRKDQAIAFVKRIKDVTGKYPVLYTGTYFLNAAGLSDYSVIGNCPLWLARYSVSMPGSVTGFLPWKLWQYSGDSVMEFGDGRLGKIDRSVFRGTVDEMRAFWEGHAC